MKTFIEIFDVQFLGLHERSCEFAALIPDNRLFWKPDAIDSYSCGEYLLRSAAAVEQTFGGITARLWDDPFEWTLPEQLSTNQLISEYLTEVEATRQRGFTFFQSDEDLNKMLPAPVKILTLFELLLETLIKAENYQGRAIAVFRQISDEKVF